MASQEKTAEKQENLPAVPLGQSTDSLIDCLEARLARLLADGRKLCLVTVINTDGQVPRSAGTRLVVAAGEAGPKLLEGTLGDGQIEKLVLAKAAEALASGTSCQYHLDMAELYDSELAYDDGLDVLCEVLGPDSARQFELAASVLTRDDRGLWIIDVTQAARPVRSLHLDLVPDEFADVQERGQAQPAYRANLPLLEWLRGRPGLIHKKGRAIYVEGLDAWPVLLLCGGGPVTSAVVPMARACGFVVDVVEQGADLADPALYPGARHCLHLPEYANLVQACGISRRHLVAIATGTAATDMDVLVQVLASHASYIGMAGSRSKKVQIYASLRERGIPDAELAAVRCPLGLSLAAQTTEQKAVALVAELLAARGGTLQRLRFED